MKPPALLIIDVQQGLDNPDYGQRNNPDAESRMRQLLETWRSRHWPVFHVRHDSTEEGSPLRPGLPGNAIKTVVQPNQDEPLLVKNVNSAFIGTDLEERLREQGIGELVVVGLTTDHCVSTSVRMAANLGFAVTLVSDGTATFERTGPDGAYYSADVMHGANLASLAGEFCTVATTDTVLAGL